MDLPYRKEANGSDIKVRGEEKEEKNRGRKG